MVGYESGVKFGFKVHGLIIAAALHPFTYEDLGITSIQVLTFSYWGGVSDIIEQRLKFQVDFKIFFENSGLPILLEINSYSVIKLWSLNLLLFFHCHCKLLVHRSH